DVEIEAHGLKETAAAGMSAAALLAAGAGAATAATPTSHTTGAGAASADPTAKLDPTVKIDFGKADLTLKGLRGAHPTMKWPRPAAAARTLQKLDPTYKPQRAGVRVSPSAVDKT